MADILTIKKRISEVIAQSNYSQTALAEILGVSQQTISHYVKGDIAPSLETLSKLCKILDVDGNYILGLTD